MKHPLINSDIQRNDNLDVTSDRYNKYVLTDESSYTKSVFGECHY